MTNRILRLRRRSGSKRIEVELEDGRRLTLAPLVAVSLRPGQDLGTEEIERLQSQDREEKVLQRCLSLLARRPRSRKEVAQYLRRHQVDPVLAERVLGRLGEQGLLDDAKFAQAWVENRLALHPRAERALRQELRLKGIEPEVTTRALEGLDELEAARRLAHSKAPRWRNSERSEFERKLGGYLARRGFSFEIVHSVLDGMYQEFHSEDPGPEAGTA
jgi:regulatory protein